MLAGATPAPGRLGKVWRDTEIPIETLRRSADDVSHPPSVTEETLGWKLGNAPDVGLQKGDV
jgi:hypothetical protein